MHHKTQNFGKGKRTGHAYEEHDRVFLTVYGNHIFSTISLRGTLLKQKSL